MSRTSATAMLSLVGLPGLIVLIASCAQTAPRRERTIDLLIALDEAEVELPAGARRPALLGDAPVSTDDDRLEALVDVGTELRFRDVPIHPRATLRYAIGPSKIEPAGWADPIHASLAFERADGTREPLVEFELDGVGGANGAWREGALDLAKLAGERGTLVVATTPKNPVTANTPSKSPDPLPRAAWSLLRVDSDGRAERASDRSFEIERVVADLAKLADPAAADGLLPLTVPGSFVVRATIPERALLRFFVRGTGFSVRVTADGAPVADPVRPRRLSANASFRAFEDVDLSAFAGREVELGIEVEPRGGEGGSAQALLALPRLLAREPIVRERRDSPSLDVFLVVVDTLRADALGCYGAARPASPFVDEFARRSLVFERAYSQCSWTLPSTATLFTGMHPDEHGVRTAESGWLHDDHETLAEALGARGYSCGAIVANSTVSSLNNFAQGFETFEGVNWSNARKVVDRALAWLDEHESDRVFEYVHFIDPHAPYDAPVPAADRFEVAGNPYSGRTFDELSKLFEDPPAGSSPPTEVDVARAVEHARALYDTEVRYFDRWFAAFVEGLRARGRLERAVILVTADHGEEFLDHGELFHGHHLYEESVRVPFLLFAPGLAPGRVATPIDGQQVKPLLLALAEAGRARSPDDVARAHFPEALHLATELAQENLGHGSRRDAVVRANVKLIVTPDLDREELYDLATDPREREDLRERQARLLSPMRELLRRFAEEHASAGRPLFSPDSPGLLERMRELGYVR